MRICVDGHCGGDGHAARKLSVHVSPHANYLLMTTPQETAIVDAALTSRRSVRAFLPTPVSRQTVEDILNAAARAPSGTNIQPWHVYVAMGAARDAVAAKVSKAHDEDYARQKAGQPPAHDFEYDYYPKKWAEPYLGRRRKLGWDMYGLLGIQKGENDKMHAQHNANYGFFGAPVGLFFTIDATMEKGGWLDCGMFIQNVMTAARGRGLHTCPQQAWSQYHQLVKAEMGIPESEVLMCGMSLGFEDTSAAVNRLVSTRESAGTFAKFVGA
jgi:nitroreductase